MDLAFLPTLVFLLLALLMLVLLILSLPALVRSVILELQFIGKPVCMDHAWTITNIGIAMLVLLILSSVILLI